MTSLAHKIRHVIKQLRETSCWSQWARNYNVSKIK